jgi:hypothetical protein
MSSTSPSPSPEPVQPIKQKKKSKDKSKKNPKVTITEHGKDERTNPDWDYVPPEGTILLDHDVDSGEFDWDAVKNDEDVELWLIRLPEGVSIYMTANFKIVLTDGPITPRSNQSTWRMFRLIYRLLRRVKQSAC